MFAFVRIELSLALDKRYLLQWLSENPRGRWDDEIMNILVVQFQSSFFRWLIECADHRNRTVRLEVIS